MKCDIFHVRNNNKLFLRLLNREVSSSGTNDKRTLLYIIKVDRGVIVDDLEQSDVLLTI